MLRIDQYPSEATKSDAMTLLGWLVCAKRSLKWHEVQGLKSIDMTTQSVQWDRRKFRISPKDLCQSLVELRPDGTLGLVHVTARL